MRVLQSLPWPARFPSRVLANDFVARWMGNEEALATDRPARDELADSIAPTTAGSRRWMRDRASG
jgi:nitronate monooxygenase